MVISDSIIGLMGSYVFNHQIPTLLNLIAQNVVPHDMIQIMALGFVTAIDVILGFGGAAKLLENM